MGLYLGIDAGTQSIKGILIDPDSGWCSKAVSAHFGNELPQYASPGGFLPNDDPTVRHADPLMWLDALDLLLKKMRENHLPMEQVCGISGSGQQHGTVYLNGSFPELLSSLKPGLTLAEQLNPALSRKTAPIWMDASTEKECGKLTDRFGTEIRARTGSHATERFSGPQIMKFASENPERWEKTATIHLVSSFLASVLSGESMPIDYGDGAGMNLLNLKTFQWDREIAEFTAPGLLDKLPPCVPSVQVCGKLSDYFAKYGLRSGIPVTVWSGDNPNSLIGCGGTDSRTAVISLGTSDTFFGTLRSFDEAPKKSGHIFGHPAGGFMSLICFTNGSLTREHFRKGYGLSYAEFDARAAAVAPGKYQMLPFLFPESTPTVVKPGIIRNFDPAKVSAGEMIRALLESQMLTMYHHAELKRRPKQIRLTGGASASPLLRQLAADIFQAPVLIGESAESAAMGAAMRAANSIAGTDFETLTGKFCRADQCISPNYDLADTYQKALGAFAELLNRDEKI